MSIKAISTAGLRQQPPPKPPRMQVHVENIPPELKYRSQWVCWRYALRDGKWTKEPINAKTGRLADSTDPSTWSTFGEAVAAWQRNGEYEGIGFVFAADDPYSGVDLDDCIDEAGELKPWGRRLIDLLDSYSEISPSGTGVKVFLQGVKPGKRCRKAYEDGEIEMYDRDRFFTITGQRLVEVSAEVQSRQIQLNAVYRDVFGDDHAAAKLVIAPLVPTLEDQEVIRRASEARNGAKFQALWLGDTSGYRSGSEADLALCGLLAFWVGPNPERIDELFRNSGLCHEKWLKRPDYRQATLARVLSNRTSYFEPVRPGPAARIAMRAALEQAVQNE